MGQEKEGHGAGGGSREGGGQLSRHGSRRYGIPTPGQAQSSTQHSAGASTLATASRDHHAGAHAHRPPLPIRGNGGDDAERGREGGARADMGARGILPRGTHRLPYIDRTHGRGEGRWRARRMGTAHGRRPRQRAGTEVGTGKAAAPSKSTPHLAPTYGYGRERAGRERRREQTRVILY